MADSSKLIEAAMGLRGSAPEVWALFLIAVQEYADDATKAMLSCPLETLQRAQGMAIAINELALTLAEAPQRHDKMQAAKLGKRHV